MKKHGFRTLCLTFIAALGLMAFNAAATQAALIELGDWLVNGAVIPLGLVVTAAGSVDAEPVLLVAELNIEIRCQKILVTEGLLSPLEQVVEGPNTRDVSLGHARFVFEACQIFEHSPLVELPACLIEKDEEAGTFNGQRVVLANALFKVERHAGSAYILASPLPPSTVIAPLRIEGCSVPLTNNIKGTLLLHFKETGNRVAQLVLPVSNQALLSDGLFDGTHPAVLSGSVEISLSGMHSGLSWGIC